MKGKHKKITISANITTICLLSILLIGSSLNISQSQDQQVTMFGITNLAQIHFTGENKLLFDGKTGISSIYEAKKTHSYARTTGLFSINK
jgi:hypothetical protein